MNSGADTPSFGGSNLRNLPFFFVESHVWDDRDYCLFFVFDQSRVTSLSKVSLSSKIHSLMKREETLSSFSAGHFCRPPTTFWANMDRAVTKARSYWSISCAFSTARKLESKEL